MQKYVAFKAEGGHYCGWTSLENLENITSESRDALLEDVIETIEFEGPDYDGSDEVFSKVSTMAEAVVEGTPCVYG